MKKLIFISFITLLLSSADVTAQSIVARNAPLRTTSRTPIPEGPDVWGVFGGRVRCQEMARVLKTTVQEDCEKLKWSFTFYHDPKTHQPTTYALRGSLFRNQARTGKWAIVKGTKDNPNANVIQLDPDKPDQSIFLLRGDENVLFVMDGNKELMVGDDYLSYTFNRTVN